MTGWGEQQQAIAAALLSGQTADVAALLRDDGLSGHQRLQVNANNIRLSLTEALRQNFAVTAALGGEQWFNALAARFIREHPPQEAALAAYGRTLPEMADQIPGLSDHPALAAMIDFEAQLLDSLAAPAAAVLTAEDFSAAATAGGDIRFIPHPAARCHVACLPVDDLWLAHQPHGPALETLDLSYPVTLLIVRPETDVIWHRLTPDAAALAARLLTGETLATAAHNLLTDDPASDLAASLSFLLPLGLFSGAVPEFAA